MTFKERLMKEHPEYVDDEYFEIYAPCPNDCGYENIAESLKNCELGCTHCWNREIPETESAIEPDEKAIQELIERDAPKRPTKDAEQNVMCITVYTCPNCGGKVTGKGIAKFCFKCGQRLDWSE